MFWHVREKKTTQNVLQHYFLLPGALSEVKETVAQIQPQCGNRSTSGILQKLYIDSSQPPCGIYMADIPKSFQTFDLNIIERVSLTKRPHLELKRLNA
jgi:hypothetical protein